MDTFIHPLADVETHQIGEGTKIWRWTHVSQNVKIGKNCMLGQGVYIGPNVVIGDNVRIQNNSYVCELVTLEDNVFLGPSCVFTNAKYPSSPCKLGDLHPTLVQKGASIGANATILCGVTIGEGVLIGAGSVVTKDMPAGWVACGNPARVTRCLR